MIYGIGIDIVEVVRVQRAYDRWGQRFADKILGPMELKHFSKTKTPVRFLAMRFAAKEACSKALGTGLRQGVFWRDMGVINLKGGKPTMVLTGGAADRLAMITPKGMSTKIDLSMTEEPTIDQASIIISAQILNEK